MLEQVPDLIRTRFVINEREENILLVNDHTVVNFSSNDYLALADHPSLKKAFIQGVDKYGLGSGSSPLVSGYYRSQCLLEEKFSEFFNRERSLLFNSGYLANVGILSAFQNRHEKIYSDKLCHASILDGIELSKRKNIRYRNNDLSHLQELLISATDKPLLITESVFSMEGRISPIKQIADMCPDNVMLIVDDAHGAGVLGENGRGIIEHDALGKEDIDCLVTPLGKAFASMGAVVSGSSAFIEYLLQFSKTYKYSTALPPAVAHATLTALQLVQDENWRRHQLRDLINFFIQESNSRSLTLSSTDLTPIKSIIIGENAQTLMIKDALLKEGFFVSCIRPPTVPKGTARLRISLNCMHRKDDILKLLDLIESLCRK
ncbi:MAG: 8-amino-7-oxononanoate synthase [Gammaproteobacteria bacterium]